MWICARARTGGLVRFVRSEGTEVERYEQRGVGVASAVVVWVWVIRVTQSKNSGPGQFFVLI